MGKKNICLVLCMGLTNHGGAPSCWFWNFPSRPLAITVPVPLSVFLCTSLHPVPDNQLLPAFCRLHKQKVQLVEVGLGADLSLDLKALEGS